MMKKKTCRPDNTFIIDTGNYCVRKTLESWHTVATNEADNNSYSLPRQYYILLKNILNLFTILCILLFFTFLIHARFIIILFYPSKTVVQAAESSEF